MPARPAVPGVCQVLFKGTLGTSHNWVNKLFVQYSSTTPLAVDLTSYASSLYGNLVSNLSPLQSVDTSLTEVEVTDLASALGAVGSSAAVTPGSRAGGEIPGSAAVLVSYSIGRHYRGGHPRSYVVAGVTTDLLDQSTWGVAFVAAVGDAWNAILAQMLIGEGGFVPTHHVNVSYYGGAPPVAGHSVIRPAPLVDVIGVGALVVQNEIASQRRRIGRR